MKKIYLFLIALLVAFSANAQYSGYYVKVMRYNSKDNYTQLKEAQPNSSGVAVIEKVTIGTGVFFIQVWDGSSNKNYTCGNTLALNSWVQLYTYDDLSYGAMKINSTYANKEINIEYNVSNNNIRFVEPQTETVPTELYIFSSGAKENWANLSDVAKPTNNKFVWNEITFTDNDFLTFTGNKTTDWNQVNQLRYGPATDGLEIKSTNWNVAQNIARGNNTAFKIVTGGKYKVTADFTNVNSPTATFEKLVDDPTIEFMDGIVSGVIMNRADYSKVGINYQLQVTNATGATYTVTGTPVTPTDAPTTTTNTELNGRVELTGLKPNTNYTYELKATMKVNGKTLEATKRVSFTTYNPTVALTATTEAVNEYNNYKINYTVSTSYVTDQTYKVEATPKSPQGAPNPADLTAESGSFNLTGLQEGTPYEYDVKVTMTTADGANTYTATKTVTFTTASRPVLYMYHTDPDGSWGTFEVATLNDAGEYVWNVNLAAGALVTFTDINENNWDKINSSTRYGSGSNDLTIDDSKIKVAQNLVKGSQNCFKMQTGGNYTITADISNLKVTFDKKSLNAPAISFQEVTNSGTAAYHTATITTEYEGGKLYYTYDDPSTTANPKWRRYYNEAFQVSGNCEIWAYVETADGTSPYGYGIWNKTYKYEWENEAQGQLNKFRVKIDDFKDTDNNGNRTLKITYIGDGDFAKKGYYNNSPFSWAKYSDYKEFDKYNASKPEDLAEYVDHLPSNDGITFAYGPNVQDNRTDTHVCRFYTKSYYRAYVQTHYEVAPVEQKDTFLPTPANSPRKYAAGQDEPQGNGVWNSVAGSTAGNVDPYATTRVAITAYTSPDDSLGTTGVEDIVTDDDAIDNDAPVIYYNLSGVRVVNPANGFYIRVQGTRAEKIYVK